MYNYTDDILELYFEILSEYAFLWLIVGIINSCIWGAITKSINENKGYDGGFAWGFWLGLIGMVVVICRQPNYTVGYTPSDDYSYVPVSKPTTAVNYNATVPSNGWRCTCNRVHQGYESSCICGKTKREVLTANIVLPEPSADPKPDPAPKATPEDTGIDSLRKYKILLDDGLITQEDYDAKKKQLLSL